MSEKPMSGTSTTVPRKPRLRTWFTGTLETRTALHIGTGTSLNPATDSPLLRGADGRPLIPGSSLKGAMRSTSERLLRALGYRACMVFGTDQSGDPLVQCLMTDDSAQKRFRRLMRADMEGEDTSEAYLLWGLKPEECKVFGQREDLQVEVLERGRAGRPPALCRACRTWGSMFMAGRLRVPDLRINNDAYIDVTEIRDGVGIDRDTGTAADRIKFDLEALPAGARFNFELTVEPEADRGVVALAVGELLQGSLPLGGRTTRGLGDVQLTEFRILEVDLSDPSQLVNYLVGRQRAEFQGKAALVRLDEILNQCMKEPQDVA